MPEGTTGRLKPGGVVGLVPDPPDADAGKTGVGAAVAAADRGHELLELARRRRVPEPAAAAGREAACDRPALSGWRELEVDLQPEGLRRAHDEVVPVPDGGGVRRRVGGVERGTVRRAGIG